MLFKRVVVFMGTVLMAIGIASSALAEISFHFSKEDAAPVVCEVQIPDDVTAQTPAALVGGARSMEMFQLKTQEDEAIEGSNDDTEIEFVEEEEVETNPEEEVEEPEEPAAKPLEEGTIVDPNMDVSEIVLEEYVWEGEVINSYIGTVQGPNGKETYYNLDMTGVIWIMEDLGYNYEYSVREDGAKMYGPFIMVAADLDLRPRGSIIKTSLGWAMVCDTGAFTQWNPTQLDIAVAW